MGAIMNLYNMNATDSKKKEPVAWSYELGECYIPATNEYVNWKKQISFKKPNVPEGSIRNLKPLYEE